MPGRELRHRRHFGHGHLGRLRRGEPVNGTARTVHHRRTAGTKLRASLAVCLVVMFSVLFTGQAHAAVWPPTGSGKVGGRAGKLAQPILYVIPAKGYTCANLGNQELKWWWPSHIHFDTYINGKKEYIAYQATPFKGGFSYTGFGSAVNSSTTFAVSYTEGKWTAISGAMSCR